MLNVYLTTFHFTTLMSKDEIKFIYFLLNGLCLLVSVSLSWVTGPWSKRQAVCAHCVSFHAELTIRQIMLVPTASFAPVWVKDLPKIKLNPLCTEQKCDQIMQKKKSWYCFFLILRERCGSLVIKKCLDVYQKVRSTKHTTFGVVSQLGRYCGKETELE